MSAMRPLRARSEPEQNAKRAKQSAQSGTMRKAGAVPTPNGGLRACYINLAYRHDRKEATEAALSDAGLRAERFEAVLGDDAADTVVVRTWDTTLNSEFDMNCRVMPNLPLSKGERGCAASHAALWARCAASDAPLLVFEDDLELAGDLASALRKLVAAIEGALAQSERTVLLYLGADSIEREGSPSSRGKRAMKAVRAGAPGYDCTEAEWAWQTHAYVLWPAAARVLLAGLPINAPVDVFLSRYLHERKLCGLVLEPMLATQVDPYGGGNVHHSTLDGAEGSRKSRRLMGQEAEEPAGLQ
jgi:GR25 family glycosyltransferase involved in LPS biosynthesis